MIAPLLTPIAIILLLFLGACMASITLDCATEAKWLQAGVGVVFTVTQFLGAVLLAGTL